MEGGMEARRDEDREEKREMVGGNERE